MTALGGLITGTVIFFIVFMVILMGVPYTYFLKRDRAMEAARDKKQTGNCGGHCAHHHPHH